MSTRQQAQILTHLRNAGSITQREAMTDYSIQSLTKRISELRKLGYKIIGVNRKHPTTGQRYKRYSLEERLPKASIPAVKARGDGFVMYA